MLMKQLRVQTVEFTCHDRVLDRQMPQFRESSARFLSTIDRQQLAGRLGAKERANTPERSGQKLQESWEHPLRLGIGIFLRDAVIDEEAEHDSQLLTSGILQGKQSTDGFGGYF
ncbi:hypothetical protein N7534_007924 [Penicillium rubens]|uniref:Uncharacterized protein n=1 Tax=Penicillium chrysogenum TaxID=5076 RepID=A0ABQ8WDX1_PENCH|nr:hypothetical protein N7505_007543 [Penicillium chrysogenum]KAJ5849235.1 hypothetical protein N7534_007924 [Penicillium rubens]